MSETKKLPDPSPLSHRSVNRGSPHTLLPPVAVWKHWAHRTLPRRKAKAHWQICPAASSEVFPVQPSGLAGSCWETKGQSSVSRWRNKIVSVYPFQLDHTPKPSDTNANKNRWHCVKSSISICKKKKVLFFFFIVSLWFLEQPWRQINTAV